MATRSTRGTAPATRAKAPTTRAAASTTATRASTRTTRATAAKADAPPPPAPMPPVTTTIPKAKPRAAPAPKAPAPKASAPAKAKAVAASSSMASIDAGDREPIKAYLRIRPHLSASPPSASPYLEHLSDTSVRMADPAAGAPGATYAFTHVFEPGTAQAPFFERTTLPLVKDLLAGENALLFAYGVTNAGKTYTVQGGEGAGQAGILPRALDVLFNSIGGLQGEDKYVPVGLTGVELPTSAPPPTTGIFSRGPSLASGALGPPPTAPPLSVLADLLASAASPTPPADADTDTTALPADKNYTYAVYLSYAEVYNEGIYDLLADPAPGAGAGADARLLLARKALPLRADNDGGRYAAGQRQVRVRSAAEARDVLRAGAAHRRVFGTLMNAQSSRSHALVTLKVLRRHRGERDAPEAYACARLTLVDLAGSERARHTNATGDRLREAGSINKSLMVLGQCMEVLRANQRKLSQALSSAVVPGSQERVDTRDVRRALAPVPFRHSKLTALLADYFAPDGGGRAVMIVNVNPYDTGFDENAHVMRFAALAREVATAPQAPTVPFPRLAASTTTKMGISGIPMRAAPAQTRRSVVLPPSARGRRETQVEVVEEDADEDESPEDEPENPLVEALFDELEAMRAQLVAALDRAALAEATTRAEVMREMNARMEDMERGFARRLAREAEQHERRTDAKIDLLVGRGSPVKKGARAVIESSEEEEDDDDDEQEEIDIEADMEPGDDDEEDDEERSASPLAGKGGPRVSQIRVRDKPRMSAHHALPDDEPVASASESEASGSGSEDEVSEFEEDEEEEEEGEDVEEDEEYVEGEDDDEVMGDEVEVEEGGKSTGSALSRFKPSSARGLPPLATPPSPIFERDVLAARALAASQSQSQGSTKKTAASGGSKAGKGKAKAKGKVSALVDGLQALDIGAQEKEKEEREEDEEWAREEDSLIVPLAKGPAKKKKVLGKGRVVGEEEIERAAREVDAPAGRVKRLTRASAPRMS